MESRTVLWLFGIFSLSLIAGSRAAFEKPAWGYKCENSLCKKVKLSEDVSAISLEVCRLTCGKDIGTVWPKPRLTVEFKKEVEQINPSKIVFNLELYIDPLYWKTTEEQFRKQIGVKKPANVDLGSGGKTVNINPVIATNKLRKLFEVNFKSSQFQVKFYLPCKPNTLI
jgi:hypothetical protein